MITEVNKIKHHSAKTKELVYEIDKQKKTGTYFVDKKCDFFKLTEKVLIKGFNKLPKGFSTDGYGFVSPAGTFLTKALVENFGEKIKFTISDKAKTTFDKTKRELILNHSDYLRILEPLRTFRTEKNIKSNQHIASLLHELFPRVCKSATSVKSIYSYEKDKLTKIFSTDPELASKLSKNDIELIAQINAKLEKENKTEFKYIDFHEKNRKKSEKVFLETLIKEFENRINKSLSENDWQVFLRKYILIFNTSYIKAIEKVNVDLRGKYPDFILVNVYNYIDIFEIKKPSTNILKHDDSRDNYYWDTEVAKAIIQTEKYINMLIEKEKDVIKLIKDKHDIEVNVVRPRGYIVVGNSNQFVNKKMHDDYRLLSSSLKNIDLILYDELLGNLKNMVQRFK